ncbi:MAG: hypothetical protein ACI841_000166 [Planctomycetota bacterium]
MHVITRRDAPVSSIREIKGQPFALGLNGSGMRASTRIVLDHLDELLERTMAIEQRLAEASSREELQECLSEVKNIKLQAPQDLTLEDLRGDRMFSIFLMQCADVASRLQRSLLMAEAAKS